MWWLEYPIFIMRVPAYTKWKTEKYRVRYSTIVHKHKKYMLREYTMCKSYPQAMQSEEAQEGLTRYWIYHEVLGRILVDGGENVVDVCRVAGDSMKCELYFHLSKPGSGLMCPESR